MKEIFAVHVRSLFVCPSTLTLSVFVVQNVALLNFGVVTHQNFNAAISGTLAMM